MRHIILSFLILHTAFASFASGPNRKVASTATDEVKAVEDFTKAFPSKKMKISELMKKLEGKIPENYLEMLKEKTKSLQNESLEFDTLGTNKVVFKAQGNEAVVEVLNLAEGQFKVNNKVTTLDFKTKPEYLMMDVEAMFPKQGARHPIMVLFLPEAEAFWGILLGVAVVGGLAYMYNNSNCEKYKNYATQCSFVQGNNVSNAGLAQLYYNIRSHDSGWFNLSLGCSSEKATVRSCQSYLETRLNGGTGAAQDTPGLIRGYQAPARQ